MKASDLISLSFENLRRRMGRSVLTIIGVVVGTCSIVVMVSLGIAMNQGFEEMLSQWSDLTQIEVYNWGSQNGKEAAILTDGVVESFGKMEHVAVATPLYQSRVYNAQIISGKKDRYRIDGLTVMGVYPAALEKLEYGLESGTYLPEVAPVLASGGKKKVQVLVGQYIGYAFTDTKKKGEKAMRYQGQTDAAGNELPPFVTVGKDTMVMTTGIGQEKIKSTPYTLDIVGVMTEDYKKGYVTSQGVVMDLTVLKRIEKEYMKANGIKQDTKVGYDTVIVKADDVKNVETVEAVLKEQGYSTHSMSSERENMQKQSQMIQMILGGLGAVSLFVAALSIANTMTMAIYERTREIGVMKVLGCELSKIRSMFLIEASMIGFLGGVFGVGVSYLISFALNSFGPMLGGAISSFLPMYGSKLSVIPVWLALVGVGFSTLIGVLSGIMPANRAVQISALEAIRHE
ncbi:MAG: ABC transporter permease [Ruthenibacterium sp.]